MAILIDFSRLVSSSQRSECSSVVSAPPSTSSAPAHGRINYTLIDFNKTGALEQLSNAKQRAMTAKFGQTYFMRR